MRHHLQSTAVSPLANPFVEPNREPKRAKKMPSTTTSKNSHSPHGQRLSSWPSELSDQDVSTSMSVLSQRAGHVLLLEDNTENQARIDEIDQELFELRAELKARARRANKAVTQKSDDMRDSGRVSRRTVSNEADSSQRRLSSPGPHIPTPHFRRDRMEERDDQSRRKSSARASSPGPHIPTFPQPKPHQATTPSSSTPPSPTTLAQTAYASSFPHGHLSLRTPDDDLLCGLYALILSMQHTHPPPHPTLPSLHAILSSSTYASLSSGFQLTNTNNFHVDQLGLVLFLWGQQQGLNLQVGYLPERGEPGLVPHPNQESTRVVWVANFEPRRKGGLGHFEGVRARGEGEGERGRRSGKGDGERESGTGIHRREWVKKLDGKVADLIDRVG